MIYLLRHGEVMTGPTRRFIGQSDCELSTKGRHQAAAWGAFFAGFELASVVCSDLRRSRQTAQTIRERQATPLRIEPSLREIHLGAWDGLEMAQVKAKFPEEWKKRGQDLSGYRPPGGESFHDLTARVMPVFEDIRSGVQGDVLIVGHAGVNRVLLCRLLGMPLQNLFRLGQDYGCLNRIHTAGGRYEIRGLNGHEWA